jgi:hypothetical protein
MAAEVTPTPELLLSGLLLDEVDGVDIGVGDAVGQHAVHRYLEPL